MSQRPSPPVETTAAPRRGHSGLTRLTRSAVFESLQYRDFRWVWLGSFASFTGMNMQMITRGWLVLRLQDDSPLDLALVMMSFAAPMTFMSLIGGALADRIPRKRLLMVSQGGSAVLAILLATLDMTGTVAFWHIMVIGVAEGTMLVRAQVGTYQISSTVVISEGSNLVVAPVSPSGMAVMTANGQVYDAKDQVRIR